MNILQSIPLPPPLIHLICSNNKIKKLRCLNLKPIKRQNNDIPSEIISSSIFSPINSTNIMLNETELDEYFKITQVAKSKTTQETNTKLKEPKISFYHLIENKNKYATSFVIIKKFQLEVMFPMNIKAVFSNKSYILTENELKFIDSHLFNYDFLVSMKIIMPSKEEMKTIMSQMNNMTFKEINSLAFIDKMYYTIAQFPEMTIFISSMISIIEMKNNLDEINQSLMNISALFESILINDKLKFIISIMLKINNYLNKSTGGRELKGFDLVSLENVLDLKINSVYFFNIVGNYYIVKYPQESLFNKTEFQYLNYALSYFSNAIEQENLKECFIKQYKEISKEIETIVQNPYIKESLYKLFIGNIEGMIEKVDELKTKEMELKERLNEYLLLESQITKEEYYAYLIKLFKIILKIEGKVKWYLGIKNKNNVLAEVNCDKVSHKAHHEVLLTEGITTAYKSNPFISNYIQNKENIYVHNENNELKESNGINTMIVSHMKESISIQSDNLSINKGQHKHNFPISGFFLKKYCL